jgi:phasin family protein
MGNSLDEIKGLTQEELEKATASASSFVKNVQAIALETASYSKTAFDDGAAFFEKLSQAKSVESALQLQTEYAKASSEAFVAQAAKIAELYAKLGKEALKPIESVIAKVQGGGKT